MHPRVGFAFATLSIVLRRASGAAKMYGWVSSGHSNAGLCDNLQRNVGISDRVMAAMKRVDRAFYTRDPSVAYYDSPQVIGYGQTISAPHMHALAMKVIEPYVLKGDTPVSLLDVGSGSGYLAACFAELIAGAEKSGHVVGIDNVRELVEWSISNVERDGKNGMLKATYFQEERDMAVGGVNPVQLTLALGDGYEGYAPAGPYDAIHVGAAMPTVPLKLIDQLKSGGCFVGPIGDPGHQEFVRIHKNVDGTTSTHFITTVRYVPLTPGIPR